MEDGEATRALKSSNIANVTYDYKGAVFCHCSVIGESYKMAYCGFEKDRNTLKYTCPAKHYGVECKGAKNCNLFKKSVRIPLSEDPRIFTLVARSSYRWKVFYKKRTSVERVNSRLDVSFGFEKHYTRGLEDSLWICFMCNACRGSWQNQSIKTRFGEELKSD